MDYLTIEIPMPTKLIAAIIGTTMSPEFIAAIVGTILGAGLTYLGSRWQSQEQAKQRQKRMLYDEGVHKVFGSLKKGKRTYDFSIVANVVFHPNGSQYVGTRNVIIQDNKPCEKDHKVNAVKFIENEGYVIDYKSIR